MPVVQALMADDTRDNGSCEVRRLMTKLNLALSSSRLFAYGYIFFITIPGLWKCIPPFLSKKKKKKKDSVLCCNDKIVSGYTFRYVNVSFDPWNA